MKTKKVVVETKEVKPKKETKKEMKKFIVTLNINDENKVFETDNVYEELAKVVIPEIISGMTTVEVKRNGTEFTSNRMLRNFETKRVFGDSVSLQIFIDNLLSQLG